MLIRFKLEILLITISKTSELLLTCGIPNVELDRAVVSVEDHRVDFDSESGDVLLLEFASQVTLDKGGLSDTTITNEDEFVLNKSLGLTFHLWNVLDNLSWSISNGQ